MAVWLRRNLVRKWLCLLIVLTSVGCGVQVGSISGTVSYNGRLLPSGKITFVCEAGDKPVLTSSITDGKYAVEDAPVGQAIVLVETFQTTFTTVPNMPPDAGSGGLPNSSRPNSHSGKFVSVPDRYASPRESGLSMTIAVGDQTKNFQLTP